MTAPRRLTGENLGAHAINVDPAEVVVAADTRSRVDDAVTEFGTRRPEWHQHAACLGKPLAWFFPEKGESAERGLQVCGMCPVRQPCLDEAIADPGLDYGVRGGQSVRARQNARRLARKRTPHTEAPDVTS